MVGCAEPTAGGAFEVDVLPVLEGRCFMAPCHGVAPGADWPEPEDGFFVALDASGKVADPAAARTAALARIVTHGPPQASSLVRVPMSPQSGGGPHFGGVGFGGPGDPGLEAVLAWIGTESAGGEDVYLTALEQRFADTVMPTLIESCGQSNCHRATDGAFAKFAPRLEPLTGLAAPKDIRSAYASTRKHLDLWSDDALRSRLLRKGIRPFFFGGMTHRRAPTGFFPVLLTMVRDAPAIKAVLEWVDAERTAIGAALKPVPSALLYVAGPPAKRAPFRLEPGPLGSDLFSTPWPGSVETAENLTASLHPDGQAEVRDPTVSHDAERVVVAMRRDGESRLRLWEIDLATRQGRAVVADSSPGSYAQPVYAPDGRIVAVWDGHGELGVDGNGVAPELVAIEADGSVQRLTFTPVPEMTPTFLASGKTRGQLLFSTRRRGPLGDEGVMFRFPLCHNRKHHGDPEYHVHFGASIAPITPLAARDMPDGRQVIIGLSGAGSNDDRGMIGMLDRSLGPMLPPDRQGQASVIDYKAAIRWVDTAPRYRDPAPMVDGRVLVAADTADRPGEDAIVALTFDDTFEVPPVTMETLLVVEGMSLRSPTAVVPRPPEDDEHETVVDHEAEHGFLAFRDTGVLEAIYGRTGPTGAREVRAPVSGVRLLAWEGVAADGVRYDDVGGSTVGLSRQPPTRILGQWSLPKDRSAWLRVPARTPLMLQWLDDKGMMVGNQLDRWYYAEGNEVVSGGTNEATYPHACGGCHGSPTGRSIDELAEGPDALSSASITLSTHKARNPREPLPATPVNMQGGFIDYRHDVGPLFEAQCLGCHSGQTPAGDLALDDRPGTGRFPPAYEQLMLRAVDRVTLRASESLVVARLLGTKCLPQPADDETMSTVVQWIESGAAYDADAREEATDAP